MAKRIQGVMKGKIKKSDSRYHHVRLLYPLQLPSGLSGLCSDSLNVSQTLPSTSHWVALGGTLLAVLIWESSSIEYGYQAHGFVTWLVTACFPLVFACTIVAWVQTLVKVTERLRNKSEGSQMDLLLS